MKSIKLCLFVGLLAISTISSANVESEIEAEKMLNIMGMEKAMTESMSQMLDIQLKQNPALAPYKSVMMVFFKRHMSWESLKPDFVQMYSEVFTASELREINAFYATDTGKKTLEKMPVLMGQGARIGTARIQNNMQELQNMIKAESERLTKLAEK